MTGLRLVVIAGPASSGKMPLARRLLKDDPNLVLVHRDNLRTALEAKLDEWHITVLMGQLARGIIRLERSPIVCAWNLEAADRELWSYLADEFDIPLEWLDVREPQVAEMIPPLHAEADAR